MKNVIKQVLILIAAVVVSVPIMAQSSSQSNYVTVQMSPDHSDWKYKVGEDVNFTIAVMKDSYAQKNIDVDWEWGPDMLVATDKGALNTGSASKSLKLKGMKKAGFMTLKGTVTVGGTKYSNYITVAFDPEKIQPHAKMPSDFQEFWSEALAESRKTPLSPTMTLLPEYCKGYADVYQVKFQNGAEGRYVYGILSMPKGEGKFPAALQVPGAGVRGYRGNQNFAKEGVIHLEIGIHGIPVTMPDEVYSNLRSQALKDYTKINNDNRDTYYYKDVYVGCVRAVDFLASLPQTDVDRMAVHGGSQGGALAITTASLDKRLKFLHSNYPALSDISGYYYGGTGGWPHMFRNPAETNLETKIKVSEYYDVVNFARTLDTPVLYGVGYNDRICPPTSLMAAYNVIPGEKTMLLTNDTGHWRYPETGAYEFRWLVERLKK